MKIIINKARPWNYLELCGDNRYDVQNMLVRQYRFPAECYRSDTIPSTYQDRDHGAWRRACDDFNPKTEKGYGVNESDMQSCTDKKFLQFCRVFLHNKELTGCRVIRYTNRANGFRCLLVMGYKRGEGNPKVKVYSDEDAPNVEQPVEQKMSMHGDYMGGGFYDYK